MRFARILMLIAMFAVHVLAACMPDGIKQTDVVGHEAVITRTGDKQNRKVTVKQTLARLGARCVRGKLVDRKGREIRFYRLQGCWGNPPGDYLEIIANQTKEIAQLKKRYTVIEMTCDPSGRSAPEIV